MDAGNNYIQILRESLEKKERLLHNLLDMTNQQADYLNTTDFEIDVFNEMMDIKGEMIEELDTIDDGFEAVYERIRIYLQEHKEECRNAIVEMQNRIREITRLSVSLQALEERNKQQLEKIFAAKNQQISQFRKSSRQVNNYYQNMVGTGSFQSSFLDKKK